MATMQQQRTSSSSKGASPKCTPTSTPRSATTQRTDSLLSSDSTANRIVALGESYYDEAKSFISQALNLDERGDRMSALDLYNKSLTLLRSGLATLQSSIDSEDIHRLRGQMERMKDQIKSRMEVLLQLEIEERSAYKSKQPPADSKSVVAGGASSHVASAGDRDRVEAKADLLFNIDSGIALFEVDHKQHVRRYEDVDALSVFKYREKIDGQPPAFIQCGGFVYPLVAGGSPVLKASEKVYMFPELRSEDGSVLGVVLESASEEELSELDTILSQLAILKVTEVTDDGQEVGVVEGEESAWGTTVAEKIDKGVSWVSVKIAQGTEVAGNLITKGANKLREKIDPNEKPAEIPDSVQKGVYYTKKASGYVVGVSDFLMISLAKLTVKAGRQATRVIASTEVVSGTEIHPQAKEAWKVTKSSVKGAAMVFVDMERAAVVVVKSMGKETSKTVGHKYGEDAGEVTHNSMSAATNTAVLAHTYWSWKTWGIHFIGRVGEVIANETREKKEHLQKNKTESENTINSK